MLSNAEFVIRRFQQDSLVDGDVQKDFFLQTMSNLNISAFQLSKRAIYHFLDRDGGSKKNEYVIPASDRWYAKSFLA